MKQIYFVVVWCIGLFILSGMTNIKSSVSENWAKEHFGKRFVSANEIGLDSLPINFSKEELQYEKTAWLIPLKIKGILDYYLIQVAYAPNPFEQTDTLSLSEAENFIQEMAMAGRKLPENNGVSLLRTNTKVLLNGTEYFKTLFCDKNGCSVINLGKDVSVVLRRGGYMSYIIDIKEGINITLDMRDGIQESAPTEGFPVATLVRLEPTQ